MTIIIEHCCYSVTIFFNFTYHRMIEVSVCVLVTVDTRRVATALYVDEQGSVPYNILNTCHLSCLGVHLKDHMVQLKILFLSACQLIFRIYTSFSILSRFSQESMSLMFFVEFLKGSCVYVTLI